MRIAIANDGLLAAEALRRVIARATAHEVIWIAHDGQDAVARCQQDRPDLLLMDLFMPHCGGVEATRRIMAQTPCAIVIATAQAPDHTGEVFAAMGAGALDVVNIPTFTATDQLAGGAELLAKIATINRLLGAPKPDGGRRRPRDEKLGKWESGNAGSDSYPATFPPVHAQRLTLRPPPSALVVIGSSAGGPSALTTILSALPGDFAASVVIVQHVDKQFAPGLTAWFATHTKLQVRVAAEGDRLQPGMVYLAGRDRHLVLMSASQLGYTTEPQQNSYCPSVDVFFQSVAKLWRGQAVGVLLTGMGRDGAAGLKALRDAGHHTIAQDKVTSAVYGMPKAAAELDAARDILALDRIAPRLQSICKS